METLATSLEILQSLPGHDDRMETYKALSVSLMASLQPMVLHEVMGSSVSALKEALYVYEKINRCVYKIYTGVERYASCLDTCRQTCDQFIYNLCCHHFMNQDKRFY